MDTKKIIEGYLSQGDWRVKENANMKYSFSGLSLRVSEDAIAEYVTNNLLTEEIKEASDNCYIKIHDVGYLSPYCLGHDLKKLLAEGLNGVPGKINTTAPKHMNSAINLMVNFLGIMQMESAGAQAYSNMDTLLAPFAKVDKLDYDEIKQFIQNFIFHMNISNRWGCQCPFSNITLDIKCASMFKNEHPLIGGKPADFTYGDCQPEMDMINRAIMEVMIGGDANETPFTFPVITINLTKDFDWESDISKLVFQVTSKYGLPYFQNFINSDLNPDDTYSMAILPTQEVIYINENGDISRNEIRHLVNAWLKKKTNYKILMNGKFIDVIDMFEVDYKQHDKYVNLTLENGYVQNFSIDHKTFSYVNNKIEEPRSQNLTTNDYQLISTKGYAGSDIGNYDSGKIIGYYLGEGWKSKYNDSEIYFAINIEKIKIVNEIKDFFNKIGCNVKIRKKEDIHIYHITIQGKHGLSMVTNFINGATAKTKRLNNLIWNTNIEFRKGVFDGLYETDGSPKYKILMHTTNKKICKDLIQLSNSIGKILSYRVNTKNTRYFKSDKSDLETFTSYELKILDKYDTIEYKGDMYAKIKIKSIITPQSKTDVLYNFTVDTDDHLYELPNGIITNQCCRIQLDMRELRKHTGGLFGAGAATGSLRVVTLNLPKLAYEANGSVGKFYELVKKYAVIAKDTQEIYRVILNKQLDNGLYPYIKRYLGTFDNHFSTIGIVGGNEACLNLLNTTIETDQGKTLMISTLKYLRELIADFQEETGNLYNLEATPAESTAHKLALFDKKQYPDIITSGTDETPYYTNSTLLPVGNDKGMLETIDHQDDLQTLYNSGTVLHFYMGEEIKNWRTCMNLVKRIASNSKLPFFSITTTYSICPICGFVSGAHITCPNDHKEADVIKYKQGVKQNE